MNLWDFKYKVEWYMSVYSDEVQHLVNRLTVETIMGDTPAVRKKTGPPPTLWSFAENALFCYKYWMSGLPPIHLRA